MTISPRSAPLVALRSSPRHSLAPERLLRSVTLPALLASLLWALSGAALAQATQPAPAPATAPQPAPAAAAGAGSPGAASVQSARLDSVWVFPERSAAATVLARNEARLNVEVSGTVLRWGADVGAQVARGQVLLQLDPADMQLALERAQLALRAAQARLELGQRQLQRAQELVAQGFFSQEALNQRQTEVLLQQAERDSAQAQVNLAQRQLARTTLRAPFAGTVVQRQAQVGELVAPGQPVFVLAESAAPEVQASVAPAEVAGLRAAGNWQFQPQGAGQAHALRLLRVAATVQPASRSQVVRLAWANAAAAAQVPSGSSGVLLWRDPQPHIPATLLVRRGNELGVFVRQDGAARFMAVPGAQEGQAAPTRLSPETQIVVRGQQTLRDGQALN